LKAVRSAALKKITPDVKHYLAEKASREDYNISIQDGNQGRLWKDPSDLVLY
jgi:hypothetical protein